MRATRAFGILIVLQGLILVGQWAGSPSLVTPAQAQPADPGRDRQAMLDELKELNGKMDRLIGILEKGELQVRTVSPDDKGNAPRGR
jgi:hypothetical protein